MSVAIIRALCILLAGILMVVFPQEVSSWFVWGIGSLILISGVAAGVAYWIRPKGEEKSVMLLLLGVVAVAGGVSILLNKDANAEYLFYILGSLPILGALSQIVSLVRLHRKGLPLPSLCYVLPLIMILFCGLLIYQPQLFAQLQILLLGIVWVIYSFFELIILLRLMKAEGIEKKAAAISESAKEAVASVSVTEEVIKEEETYKQEPS